MNKAFPTLFPGGTWQWVVDGVPCDVRGGHPGQAWHPGLEHQLVPVPLAEVAQKDPDTLINFQHGCDKNARRPYVVASKRIWEHLMRHHSGRFQSHARWKYWAFNTEVRSNNFRTGQVFADREARMSVEELQAAIENGDQNVLKKLKRWNSSNKGSTSYWYTER